MVDVLIIGSGGAGLTAALSAKEAGASVLVVGKAYPTNSQTSMAQGGINAELESGEAVLNRRSMSNPYLRELASQINQAGGGVKFADGGLVGISEAQNILNNTLSAVSNAPQVPVLVTEDLDAVQNRVAVTEAFSTL